MEVAGRPRGRILAVGVSVKWGSGVVSPRMGFGCRPSVMQQNVLDDFWQAKVLREICVVWAIGDFLKKLKGLGRKMREVSIYSPLVADFLTGDFFVEFRHGEML